MTSAFTHLVGFVVVLWVVLEDTGLLCVIKIPHEIVYPEVLPPLLAIREPADSSAMGDKTTLTL